MTNVGANGRFSTTPVEEPASRRGKKIFALDVTTGQRTLVREIGPRDTVGVDGVVDTRLTPDGKSYAYVYIRSLYSLYQVSGLK